MSRRQVRLVRREPDAPGLTIDHAGIDDSLLLFKRSTSQQVLGLLSGQSPFQPLLPLFLLMQIRISSSRQKAKPRAYLWTIRHNIRVQYETIARSHTSFMRV